MGFLMLAGRALAPQTLDALAGFAALAVERFTLLGERESAARARERAELSDALLASFSHNLRTPLTAIEIAASNLKEMGAGHTSGGDQAAIIAIEVARLKRLFQNIVDLARIDAERVAAERRWTDASEIVEAAVTYAEPSLRGRPLDVHTDSQLVLLDPRLTAAALGHLIDNAVQYSPSQSPITIRARANGPDFLISVRDRGRGISDVERTRLFERFFRGADARRARAAGTGMGLAIAQGLAAAQGGTIDVANHPEGGAEFSIRLPAQTRSLQQSAQT